MNDKPSAISEILRKSRLRYTPCTKVLMEFLNPTLKYFRVPQLLSTIKFLMLVT